MARKRSPEPYLWLLFSAGGVLSALLMPVLVLLFGLVFPLGWISPPAYEDLLGLLRSPITRIVLFALCALSLCHWAHRFRYTLYDGLQIKHLKLISMACYGVAIIGSVAAGYLLLISL